MFCEDLSAYHYSFATGIPGVLSVGWIDQDQPFTTGHVLPAITDQLRQLVNTPICVTRGYHVCHLCSDTPQARGNGELWLRAHTGLIYAVPSLLPHYIEYHDYRPPDEFLALFDSVVDAVLEDESAQLLKRQSDRLRSSPCRDDILVELYDTQLLWKPNCFPDLLSFERHLQTLKEGGARIPTDWLSRRTEGFSLNMQSRSPGKLFSEITDRHGNSYLAPYKYRYRLVYMEEPWTIVEP